MERAAAPGPNREQQSTPPPNNPPCHPNSRQSAPIKACLRRTRTDAAGPSTGQGRVMRACRGAGCVRRSCRHEGEQHQGRSVSAQGCWMSTVH